MAGSRPTRRRALVVALASAVLLGCAVAGIAVAAVALTCRGCTDEPAAAPTTPAPVALDDAAAAAVERLGAPFPASVDAQAVVDEVERRHSIDPEPYLQWGSAEEELRVRWQCSWEVEALDAVESGDGARLRTAIAQLDVAQGTDTADPAWFAEVVAPVRDGLVGPLTQHVEDTCPSPVR